MPFLTFFNEFRWFYRLSTNLSYYGTLVVESVGGQTSRVGESWGSSVSGHGSVSVGGDSGGCVADVGGLDDGGGSSVGGHGSVSVGGDSGGCVADVGGLDDGSGSSVGGHSGSSKNS